MRGNYNSFAFGLITYCRKPSPERSSKNKYPIYFQLDTRITQPLEISLCLKTGELQEISRSISQVAPELPNKSVKGLGNQESFEFG